MRELGATVFNCKEIIILPTPTPGYFESFRQKERNNCPTKLRKGWNCQILPYPMYAGQNGLLMIHGKRTMVLLAASHVINWLRRELAAFSRSGI